MAVTAKAEMRLDVYLTKNGLSGSRNKAKELIEAGCVYINGRPALKPSLEVSGEEIAVKGGTLPYVGRGGLKLEAALDAFGVDVRGVTAADIGASTGGFTDCLLQRGAAHVYAVDSGCGQLHQSLRNDARVTLFENFNARQLTRTVFPKEPALAVMDVSFISQRLLYPAVSGILPEHGMLISLIKPQFEAGHGNVGKNGVVRDISVRRAAIINCIREAENFDLYCHGLIISPIKGGDGNVEFLSCFKKSQKCDADYTDNGYLEKLLGES